MKTIRPPEGARRTMLTGRGVGTTRLVRAWTGGRAAAGVA